MCICVIKFSLGLPFPLEASVTKPDQADTSEQRVIWIAFTWTGVLARDKVKGLAHHKLIIDFFALGSQVLKLRVLRIASVAKAKFRIGVK